MQGVTELGQAFVGPGRRRINVRGTLHLQGLVGSLGVELLHEGVEAGLLLQAVGARRSGGLLLQGQMHALVAAVLLRMAGLDAFDRDAEPQPPDRELGKVEQAVGTGEGNTVVRSNRLWQAALPEETLEGGDGQLFAGRPQGFAQKQVARGMVGDSQRVAILAVAEPELAFEIGAPQLVGTGSYRQLGTGGTASGPADRLDQAVPVQDPGDGALGRPAHAAGPSPQRQFAEPAGAPVRLLA